MLGDKTHKILDKEHLLESANDSARHFRNVYLAYLTVMIYIFIIVLSTEQELLFRAGGKQLPLIHISVPIVAFFTWMPWALLVLHFYLLIQVTFLSDKVRLYRQEINDRLISKEDIRKAKMLLAPVPLVHILVEEKAKSILYAILLYLIVFVSLVVFPLIVLIVAQMKFLPYQNEDITLAHSIAVMIDIFLLWCFGLYVFRSHKEKRFKNIWKSAYDIARVITSRQYLAKWFKNIWKKVILLLVIVILAIMSIFTIIFIFGCLYIPNDKINTTLMISECPYNWYQVVEETLNFPSYFNLPRSKLVKKEPAPELLAAYIKEEKDLIEPGSSIWCQYADPLDLKRRNFRKAQLEGAALCEAILPNADFTDASLKNASLISTDLRDANLTEAGLRQANLTKAVLTEADLIRSDLRQAILTEADLRQANLTKAVLTEADLRQMNLTKANFTKAVLIEADLRQADLTEANFTKAVLTEADLRQADLTEANFTKAVLTKADLRQADIKEVDLSQAILIEADLRQTTFTEAVLEEADLRRAVLTEAVLIEADLRRAVLTKADLRRAVLTKAELDEAQLNEAKLNEAELTEADLRQAVLTEAVLTEAVLRQAKLREADFRQADLTKTDLRRADLRQAVLTEADLNEADLIQARLEEADLSETDLSRADLTAVNLSETDFYNATLKETILDLIWVWESSDSIEKEYFPRGNPKGWDDTLKPEYLCPEDFNISKYIDRDDKVERKQLKARLKEVIGENCKRYYP